MPRHLVQSGTLSLMALCLGTLCGCASADRSVVSVMEQDAGRTIGLRTGDVLKVRLHGNPSTGFGWYAEALETAVLKQQGDWVFSADNTSPGITGAPGTLTTTFEAVGAGQTKLRLIYHQPFDPKTPPARTFEVNVTVGKR